MSIFRKSKQEYDPAAVEAQSWTIAQQLKGVAPKDGKPWYNVLHAYETAGTLIAPDWQHELARCYHFGWGCPVDINKALIWYVKAAGQGQPYAMMNIGGIYHETC
jgi:TPR repeat protein